MFVARRFLSQPYLAALLCVATLLVKLLVPAGYMIGSDHGHVTFEICSGVAGQPMAMPGMMKDVPGHAGHGESRDHGKPEAPCAFTGLSAASLAVADPVQIAALIVFILAIGLTAAAPFAVIPRPNLRPPLRGPPASL